MTRKNGSTTPLRRPRTNNEPTSRVLMWGAIVGFGLIGGLWLASVLFNGVPLRDYGKLYVSADQLGNISTHDSVRISGVRVGQVVTTDVDGDSRARAELQLEPGVDVPTDSKVRIRANGLLGARYVELVPGRSARNLGSGATLRADADALTYGVPETLDTFDEPTRAALATAVGGLGQGLLGQGLDLNETGRDVAREVPNANRLLRTLNSAPEANAALIPSLKSGMGALDENRIALGDLLEPTAQAVTPLASERTAVQDTLGVAPGSLRTAAAELARGRRLLTALRALSVAARSTLSTAPGGLRAATRLLDEARSPVGRTDGLLRSAGSSVGPVLRLTRALSPVLKPLQDGLDALTPTLATLGRYGCDLQNFATTWRSMTGYAGPGEGSAGPAMAFRLQITPPAVGEAVGLEDAQGRKDPYPAPCKWGPSVYPNVVSQPGRAR